LAAARLLDANASPTIELVTLLDKGITADLEYARATRERQLALEIGRITGLAKLEYDKEELAAVRRQLATIAASPSADTEAQAWINFGQALRDRLKTKPSETGTSGRRAGHNMHGVLRMAMTTRQWWLYSLAMEWVAADLAGLMAGMRVPSATPPTKLDDLEDYIPAKVVKALTLMESVEIADKALNDSVAELAAEHLAAAAVVQERPSNATLKTIKKDLQTVSDRLKDVTNFRAVAKLAGALADLA
jgi:hypothetical protein